jgi:hypothetical protein
MSLLELYCHVDDFWQTFEPLWENELLQSGVQTEWDLLDRFHAQGGVP